MKTQLFLLLVICAFCAQAEFSPLNLANGGRYLATGTFCSYTNVTQTGACQNTTWAQDPSIGVYFQDIGTGGQYYYGVNASYAIRGGFCFQIAGYTSATLTQVTYGKPRSIVVDNKPDDRTYFGLGPSTCGTPLANEFTIDRNGRIKSWWFAQVSPIQSYCFDVLGVIDINDFEHHFDSTIFNLPPPCATPIPVDYCNAFYFQPGEQCGFARYP